MMQPIIFIPGIEATSLVNTNSLDFQTVWNAFDSLASSAGTKITGLSLENGLQFNVNDGLGYDTPAQTIIERGHLASLPYSDILQTLSRTLTPHENPIYLFGYDWRQSNRVNGNRLALFIEYLKAKLRTPDLTCRFVTHSMGALVLLSYLYDYNTAAVDRVVMCAPPFRGSSYSLIHMLTGNEWYQNFLNRTLFGHSGDIRKIMRTFPSVFELLPWYQEVLVFEDDNAPVDLLNIDHWQSNLTAGAQRADFANQLLWLADFRRTVGQYIDTLPNDAALLQKIIVVAGEKEDTIQKLRVRRQGEGTNNLVVLDGEDDDKNGSGDGTVPLASSTVYADKIPTFAVKKASFAAHPADFEFHGLFLRDSRVQNIVTKFMTPAALPTAPGWWQSIGNAVRLI